MAGRPSRGLDPTRTICPDCGGDILFSDVGVAGHRARHLEAAPSTYPVGARLEGWRAYSHALEAQASDFRSQLAEGEDERRRLLEDVATRDDYIAEVEADLTHERTRIA